MDRLTLFMNVVLVTVMLLTIWRLWVLSKEAEKTKEKIIEAKISFSSASRSGGSGNGLPCKVYNIVYNGSDKEKLLDLKSVKDGSVFTGHPLSMVSSLNSGALASDVLNKEVKFLMIDGKLYAAEAYGTHTTSEWTPEKNKEVIWLFPVNQELVGSFPFPVSSGGQSTATDNENVVAYVLGM
ncbi:hypothetical protein TetV_161 [Tetraselmis virus 1]|uniref:Uncharacterized protein n=1 Tax=Tetraselmis virus 1 TaxID=2060617 RepID=A0A2P0VMY7_9VIRU|nr:hypothetical protein QJ968_gp161 [Tetraselmis virus 1]AUF82253.1 hypothetical protein TetV_161 [Tetraselmis virus 1]